MEKLLFHKHLKTIYKLFMKKQIFLERKKVFVSRMQLSFMLQEIKEMVLEVSHYSKNDPFVAEKDYAVAGTNLEKITEILHNAIIDLQFAETENARQKYLQLLSLYESLSEQEKALAYDDIARLFEHIKYALSWGE